MAVDYVLDDGKPQPSSTAFRAHFSFHPKKTLTQTGQKTPRDAGARIRNPNKGVSAILDRRWGQKREPPGVRPAPPGNLHHLLAAAGGPDLDVDFPAWGGIFYGVVDQVLDHLGELKSFADDQSGR